MLMKHTASWWLRLAIYIAAARVAKRALGSWTRLRNGLLLAALANAIYSRATKKQLDVSRDGDKEFAEAGLSCTGAKFRTADGTVLQYYLVSKNGSSAGKKRLVLLANGLGCRWYYWIWMLKALSSKGYLDDVVIMTWDYRGQFMSGETPSEGPAASTTSLSIRQHALDGLALVRHFFQSRLCVDFGVRQTPSQAAAESVVAAVPAVPVIGWSTGVQVGLEMSLCNRRAVRCLVLLNGAHGWILHSFLQPAFTVPFVSQAVHAAASLLRWNPVSGPIRSVFRATLPAVRPAILLFAAAVGARYGALFQRYLEDVVDLGDEWRDGPSHTRNYFKLAQALDAHSVLHSLGEVPCPVSIVAGMWDVVTPAYHSFDMADRIPDAELHVFEFGSHFCNLEFPSECAEITAEFLSRHYCSEAKLASQSAATGDAGRAMVEVEEKVGRGKQAVKTLGDSSDVETESTASSTDIAS